MGGHSKQVSTTSIFGRRLGSSFEGCLNDLMTFTERLKINETLLCTTPSNCSEVNGEVSIKTSPGELHTLLAT